MNVSQLLASAFTTAHARDRKLHEQWIKISHRVGGKLPHSLLGISIQRIGEIDMMLRAMEDEVAPLLDDPDKTDFVATSIQGTLSDLWVGSLYEVFRLLKERNLVEQSDEFVSLAHHLRLLRVPIEKHEIPADRKLTGPLQMQRNPPRDQDADIYVYAKDDRARAHIMPVAVTRRGSLTWQVIDLLSDHSYWIERRWIADRVISLWSPP